MPLRELRVFLPADHDETLNELIREEELEPLWKGRDDPGWTVMTILAVDVYKTEKLISLFMEKFQHLDHFRIVLVEAAAVLPLPETDKEREEEIGLNNGEGDNGGEEREEEKEEKSPSRVVIEELLENLRGGAALNGQFFAMVILSTLVAAVGLMQDNTAVVIGAMVIAPLLGPNISLALGTTLGKLDLITKSAVTNVTGVAVALAFAFLIGLVINFDPEVREIASRTSVGYGDLVLALAAGAAGALSITTGVSASLVGVMVAVALLPPLVAGGLLLGAGHWDDGASALLLTLANVIMVNLAAVVTFVAQRVRPRNFWEEDVAGRMLRRALAIWITLFVLLIVIVGFLS